MKITRRGFVRGLGAASVLSTAGLATFVKRARAVPPARALFVYVPDGCVPSRWHATGSERGFTLPDMSSPLEAIRDECVFLDGLSMYAGGNTHEGGAAKVLTGVSDESIDIYLGGAVGAASPFESIQLGVGATFQNGSGSISYVGGTTLLPEDNPLQAFERLFGAPGGDDLEAMQRRARRASVLDRVASDVTTLRDRLGGTERVKLDTFLESLEQVERRLAGAGTAACGGTTWNSEGFTDNPMDYYPRTFHKEENFGLIGKLQMDLMVLALGCGATQIGTLMWSHAVSPTRLLETTSPMGNHDASHCGGPTTAMADNFAVMKRWFMERFVYLVRALDAVPDEEGTLLDNTVVLLCSELGDSDLHDHHRVPFVVAGGSRLGLTGGRFLDYRGSHAGENAPHTKLLVSIARAVGAPVDRFGYDGHGTGPLEGLFG
jgi:hypothetical protein